MIDTRIAGQIGPGGRIGLAGALPGIRAATLVLASAGDQVVPPPHQQALGPGCFERSTARYGLRSLPLCRGCAAALRGEACQWPITPLQARAIGGPAA